MSVTCAFTREKRKEPRPEAQEHGPHFVVTLWRDWLTDEVLAGLGLNERQMLAVAFLKTNRRISNSAYLALARTTKKTATRDLTDLKEKGLVEQRGHREPGVHYILAGKRDKKETMET